ncbi:MAG: NAD(P)H-binding protein [Candidatus Paceibacterota bacterium]
MKIAIIGASGFVGINLTRYLLLNTDHQISAISINPHDIHIDEKYKDRVKIIKANVLNYDEIENALYDIDIAYYFIHMMASDKNDFYDKETRAAKTTGRALKSKNIRRLIYMSGLGNDDEKLSKHLLSRHNTGNILRKYVKEVIEFRASMIIGKGSISFEIVKNLVEKSPIITLPKWSKTKTQPIGITDALLYLENSIDVEIDSHEIIEIGGSETMSYLEFVKKYAKFKNKKMIIFRIPILPEKIAGLFLNLFTSKEQTNVGRCMLSSFKNEMIVTNNRALELFPDIHPKKIEEFFL